MRVVAAAKPKLSWKMSERAAADAAAEAKRPRRDRGSIVSQERRKDVDGKTIK